MVDHLADKIKVGMPAMAYMTPPSVV